MAYKIRNIQVSIFRRGNLFLDYYFFMCLHFLVILPIQQGNRGNRIQGLTWSQRHRRNNKIPQFKEKKMNECFIFLSDKKTDKHITRKSNLNYEILKTNCHYRTALKYLTSSCKRAKLIRKIGVKIYIKAAKLKDWKLTEADMTC